MPTIIPAVTRRPRMHALPPMTAGSSVMRGKRFIVATPNRCGRPEQTNRCRAARSGSQRRLDLLDDRVEAGRVAYGQVGQGLTVQSDARFLQAGDEHAVAQPALARRGVDADDPQRAKVALAHAAVAEGEHAGTDER